MLGDRGAFCDKTGYAVDIQGCWGGHFKVGVPSSLMRNGRTYDPAIQVVLTRRGVGLHLAVFYPRFHSRVSIGSRD